MNTSEALPQTDKVPCQISAAELRERLVQRSTFMNDSRYIVGIDLGTTNSAVSFVDMKAFTEEERALEIQYLPIPQLVHEGSVKSINLLPSFLYLPGQYDLPEGSLDLPWASNQNFVVGELAEKRGAEVPQRLVFSAKSWLCHGKVDRKAPILPWGTLFFQTVKIRNCFFNAG